MQDMQALRAERKLHTLTFLFVITSYFGQFAFFLSRPKVYLRPLGTHPSGRIGDDQIPFQVLFSYSNLAKRLNPGTCQSTMFLAPGAPFR